MNKLQTIFQLLISNGPRWFFLYLAERTAGKTSPYFFNKRMNLEIQNRLPGFNTRYYNYKEWNNYDWTREGEEWTDSDEWKTSLIDEIIKPNLKPGGTTLEIGPGAGRWSVVLAELSDQLILVDMTERSIEHCKRRLKMYSNCQFYRNNGTDLSFLEKDSVDFLWSFDVFVHLAPLDIESYLRSLNEILRDGGTGIIHHAAAGGRKGGFRSSMTNTLFCSMLEKYKFEVIRQLDSWGKDGLFNVRQFEDKITIFRKLPS